MAIGDKQKLITNIIGTVLNEPAELSKKFKWFINSHKEENFGERFSAIDNIFNVLKGDVIANQAKRLIPLNCDAYFGGQFNFIFEFDEFQHFSSARLNTFESYPPDVKFNFDLESWKMYCSAYKEKADKYRRAKTTQDFNFVGGRTAQRAYLDCFRDLLPKIHGLNPTLRVSEFEVSDIFLMDKDACIKIERLLKSKLN